MVYNTHKVTYLLIDGPCFNPSVCCCCYCLHL